jgi:hypothetical protein
VNIQERKKSQRNKSGREKFQRSKKPQKDPGTVKVQKPQKKVGLGRRGAREGGRDL